MSSMQSIWQMYRELPRAAQWGVAALVGVVLFLVWNDVVLSLTGQLNREADRLLAEYDKAAGNEQRLKNLRAVQDVVRGLGEVARPGREAAAEAAFNSTVNSVLKQFTVSNDSFNYGGGRPMKRGTLSKIVPSGFEVRSVSGDLRFDATPAEAVAIIAELENSSDIEAINNVRITKQSAGGKVTVDLTLEAWIIAKTTRARGA